MEKRKKVDRVVRAFEQGYKAGQRGHGTEHCPFITVVAKRGSWFEGWREGRSCLF